MENYETYYKTYGSMTNDELNKELETLGNLRRNAAETFQKELKDVITRYTVYETGVKDIGLKCWHNNIYSVEIGKWGPRDSYSDSWDFDFAIDRWHKDENGKRDLHCAVNIGISGSFIHTNAIQIEKFSVFGCVCKNLKLIENEVLNLDSFKFFDESEEKVSVINNILKSREVEKEKEEREAKRVYFTSKISVGTIIDMRPEDNPSDEDTGWYTEKIRRLKNQEIVWKTEKNVRFADDYGRTKMEGLIGNLISGKWKIVEKTLDNKVGA